MSARFDLFERLPDGRPMWIASFETLEEARAHLKETARDAIGDCFIYSEERGVIEIYRAACTDSTLH